MKLTLLILLPLATAFPLSLFKRADLTLTTQNDLLNGTPCKPLTVIFARGTTSPGNVGESTGPPFFQEIAKLVGAANLAVQGVTYPASIFGFLGGGDTAGSKTLAGQGGQLVHNAARQLSAAVSAKVSSVVIFGDPNYGSAVGTIPASKVKVFCHTGDNICEGGITVTSAHLNYKNDAPAAAKFVASLAGY
ncbi:putative Cutinase [Glarea lozoyensis 74030]|uniref:cutinase n=1 Tax=Glarea lozoyensis (strain ATCC 74030 / MF5533) TaxID=1104152 RepID=H0EYV2_GLAL7|nr:putative Cutinase [Glarea lozoyensis 74030]